MIGVEDKSRHVRGVPDPLVGGRENCKPGLGFHTPAADSGDRSGAVAESERTDFAGYPSNTRPHYLQRLGPDDGVFIRVGSTNRKADSIQIEELRRWNPATSFDERAIPDLNPEAIDFRAASELFAPWRKLTPQAMSTLRLTTEHQGRQTPTIGGLLLFGKDRFARFPDAWIRVGRFAGTNRVRLIDSAEIRSYLPRAAEEAVEFAKKHLTRESIVEGLRREDRWSVPLVAIREALMNAVVHADYAQQGAPIRMALFDDRIEIENPGLLPFGLTIEDILQGVSRLRNRVIGRVFHELHLIEQWGSGIQRMAAACLEAGLAVPRFEEICTHFRVTIFNSRVRPAQADETDVRILGLFTDGEARSTSIVAKRIGISQRATLTRLKALTSRGLLVEIGTGPHDPRRQYAGLAAPGSLASDAAGSGNAAGRLKRRSKRGTRR